jgi:CheY-like chemotaxis protein
MIEEKDSVRVLVVDDDALSREVLALLLEQSGYAVETSESGDAALARLGTGRDLPGVVLADMQMPGVTGGELAVRLREACGGGTVLLAMSGSEPEEAERREFDGFLLKPFSMEALAGAIAGGEVVRRGDRGGEEGQEGEVLDEIVYRKLAGAMRSERLEQLFALCLTDAERRVAGMRQAASNGDDATYRREAHAIKGGCGMVGAVKLQTLATSMETRGLDDTNHVASLDEFMMACEGLRRILVARAGAE